jgi:hypothetical protein
MHHDDAKGLRHHVNIRVLCPGLFGPPGTVPGSLPETPRLDRLLGRADDLEAGPRDPLESLADAFGLTAAAPDRDLPTAALCLLAEAPDVAPHGCWFHADPVYLRPDRDRLLLFAGPSLGLQESEAEALISAFNLHFAEDGLALKAIRPGRWYLRVRDIPELRTWPLHRVHGHSVDGSLPTGLDAGAWMRWQNEAQMLFFQHPVNRARELAGRPTIGGVWTWGGGRLPKVPGGPSLTFADHLLAVGLARASGGRVLGLDALSRIAEGLPSTAPDFALAFWDRPWWPALAGDWDAWGRAVAELEAVVDRLLADLKAGRIGTLSLDDGTGRRFEVTRRVLMRFWRRGGGLRDRIGRSPGPSVDPGG